MEAKVVALGPKNSVVSFLILDNRTRLEVRSGFDSGRFQDLAAAIEKRLPFTEDRPESETPEAKTVWQQIKSLEGLYGKAVVGMAVLLSSGGTFAAQRLISKDAIALIAPSGGDGSPRRVRAGCIPIEWEVRGQALFADNRTLLREVGTVQVDADDGRRVPPLSNFRSGDQLYVPAGRWVVYVYDPVRQQRSPSIAIEAVPSSASRDSGAAAAGNPRLCAPGGGFGR